MKFLVRQWVHDLAALTGNEPGRSRMTATRGEAPAGIATFIASGFDKPFNPNGDTLLAVT